MARRADPVAPRLLQLSPKSASVLQDVIDAIPFVSLVVDGEMCVHHMNGIAREHLGGDGEVVLLRPGGEVWHCLHAMTSEDGCGNTPLCSDCVIRNAVETCTEGNSVQRERYPMSVKSKEEVRSVSFLVSASHLEFDGTRLVLLLLEDATDLVELRRLLPMCASCRRIRSDEEYWEQLETYLWKHTEIEFTHGLCPDCSRKLYPGLSGQVGHDQRNLIRALHDQGHTNSEIARFLGVTEGTIRYHLRRLDTVRSEGPGRPPIASQYYDAIAVWLGEQGDESPLSLTDLHQWLVTKRGYPGSLRSVQRFIANHLPAIHLRTRGGEDGRASSGSTDGDSIR